MSKIGYIRVSTEHQETARQQEIMCDYQVDRIFSEKLSGANTDRPQLRAMLDYVREGDTLYIESISRLGRSTKDLLNIIDTLTEKGVTLISHKEKIDTDTPTGKFMLTVFAALSQLEREQLKQRQREGIEIAKAQGKYTGRKPIPHRLDEVRATLWGMESEAHHGQGLYAQNGYVGKYILSPCA